MSSLPGPTPPFAPPTLRKIIFNCEEPKEITSLAAASGRGRGAIYITSDGSKIASRRRGAAGTLESSWLLLKILAV